MPEVGWRDRHAFSRARIENRSPLNDLRVVSFLYSTPQWIKQFDGRRRSILRCALSRRNLALIANRDDKGFYNEQLIVGLAHAESRRFAVGIAAICDIPDINSDDIHSAVSLWKEKPRMSEVEPYRLAAAGLWYRQVDGHKVADNTSFGSTWSKEVILQ